jgi:hypothetical protein
VNLELLERAADALGELRDEVVFVGGATVELWITDPAAPEVRPTYDVDVVVEVVGRRDYRAFEVRLGQHGFRHDQESGVTCRFRHAERDLVLDAMPLDPRILGGRGDFLGSRDFGDVVALIDGRVELVEEVRAEDPNLREHIASEFAQLRTEPLFHSGLAGATAPDAASQERIELVLLHRIEDLIHE